MLETTVAIYTANVASGNGARDARSSRGARARPYILAERAGGGACCDRIGDCAIACQLAKVPGGIAVARAAIALGAPARAAWTAVPTVGPRSKFSGALNDSHCLPVARWRYRLVSNAGSRRFRRRPRADDTDGRAQDGPAEIFTRAGSYRRQTIR
jgi:hypothetical protein